MNTTTNRLTSELLRRMDAYWRAANYLSVGQIYLLDNPLLRDPLEAAHVKPRLLGHWGTTPGQNFLYVHLNRVIREYGLSVPHAYVLSSACVDLRISQIVDAPNYTVSALLPLSIFQG